MTYPLQVLTGYSEIAIISSICQSPKMHQSEVKAAVKQRGEGAAEQRGGGGVLRGRGRATPPRMMLTVRQRRLCARNGHHYLLLLGTPPTMLDGPKYSLRIWRVFQRGFTQSTQRLPWGDKRAF